MRYVKPLTPEDITLLETHYKTSPHHRERERCKALLLSNAKNNIRTLAAYFGLDSDTIHNWIKRWETPLPDEKSPLERLKDAFRSGRPSLLTADKKSIEHALPTFLRSIRAYLAQRFGTTMSRSSFRRWLKNWAKRSCKAHRDETWFSFFQQELKALKAWEDQGENDLFFYDKIGLNLIPSIPYGWQTIGQTVKIPSRKSSNISIAGFLCRDNRFISWEVQGAINTEMIVKIFEEFAQSITKKTVVILDNASSHTAKLFQDHLPGWRQKGLLIQFIPAHCPELNYIEMLCGSLPGHKIKYEWMEREAFLSKDNLLLHLDNILKEIGNKYRITCS